MHSVTILLSRRLIAACALMVAFAAGTARAADITLQVSMPAGQSWASANYWSDNLAAHSGADYFVGVDRNGVATPGTGCRTPTTDATFPGDSLNIGKGGAIGFKPTSTQTYTFNNLVMTSGSQISQSSDTTTAIIEGNISLSGVVNFNSAAANVRKFTVNAVLSGSGLLKVNMNYSDNNDVIAISNNSNTFSGTIEQTGGTFKLLGANCLGQTTKLTINPAYVTGSTVGTLDPDVDVLAKNTDLEIGSTGKIQLDQKMTFKSVTINGTKLANGIYTAADLQAQYAAYVTNSGGTLQVGNADVLQTATMPSATPVNTWLLANFWSDNQTPHTGADYFVGRTRSGALTPAGAAEVICRTPDTGSELTFPGDSLTIGSNSQLRMKAPGGAIINIADLTLTSGTLDNGNDNTSYTIRGHLLVQGNSRFRTYDNANRQLIIESLMEGPASANIQHLANTTGVKSVILANNANTYAGTITSDAGMLILNARGALGKARLVTISGTSLLQSIVPISSSPSTTLTLSGTGKLDLRNVVGFGNVIIGGKTLAPGKYKASALMTSFSANIVNNGGELQVGFDPSPVRGSWLFN